MYGQTVLRAAIMPQCTTGKSEPEGRRQQFQILLENRLAAFAHPEPIPVHEQRALRGDGHKLELRAELAVQLRGPARVEGRGDEQELVDPAAPQGRTTRLGLGGRAEFGVLDAAESGGNGGANYTVA